MHHSGDLCTTSQFEFINTKTIYSFTDIVTITVEKFLINLTIKVKTNILKDIISKMLIIFAFLLFFEPASAFIPLGCNENATRPSGMCCPKSVDNGLVCGGPERGECRRIQPCTEEVPNTFKDDDRVAFPSRWFTYLCFCNSKYRGVDCGLCNHGLTGRNCDQQKPLCTRKNIMKLSPEEKSKFVQIFVKSLTFPSDVFVVIEDNADYMDPAKQVQLVRGNVHYVMSTTHRFCSRSTSFTNEEDCAKFGILDFNHGSCAFISWHRMLSLQWEDYFARIARHLGIDDNYCVPYWNWLNKENCDICTNDLIGAEGKMDEFGPRLHSDSPFNDFKEFCTETPQENGGSACQACHFNENFGMLTRKKRTECKLPTASEVKYCFDNNLKLVEPGDNEENPTVCSVSRCIEGSCGPPDTETTDLYLHNKVHNCFDGSMCCSATANADPMFVLHHVMVDRIFSIINRRRQFKREDIPTENCRPGHGRECYMCGYIPVVKVGDMIGPPEQFGYEYDNYEIDAE